LYFCTSKASTLMRTHASVHLLATSKQHASRPVACVCCLPPHTRAYAEAACLRATGLLHESARQASMLPPHTHAYAACLLIRVRMLPASSYACVCCLPDKQAGLCTHLARCVSRDASHKSTNADIHTYFKSTNTDIHKYASVRKMGVRDASSPSVRNTLDSLRDLMAHRQRCPFLSLARSLALSLARSLSRSLSLCRSRSLSRERGAHLSLWVTTLSLSFSLSLSRALSLSH
jgi:hypothetical protein